MNESRSLLDGRLQKQAEEAGERPGWVARWAASAC